MKTALQTLTALLFGVAGNVPMALAQSAGTFTATGNMLTARFAHTATLLPDGKVLIAGGCSDGPGYLAAPPFCRTVTATAEIYDPATGTFMATGNMTSPRAYHTATVLSDGRVLIAAGRVGYGGPDDNLTSAELYDPSTGIFSATGQMHCKEAWTSTLLPDGRFLISGSCVELYDPAVGTFTATPGRGGSATLLGDGRVLFASPYSTSNSLYDPGAGTFSPTSPMVDLEWVRGPVTGRAILLKNGRVLFVGGNSDPGPVTGAELYDSSTEQFVATGNMSAARANHTATLLLDGKALITGGSTWISSPPGIMYHVCCLASAEVYDTATGLFADTGRMAAGRTGHTATQLTSSKILIVGGSGGSDIGALGTAELYQAEQPSQ